MKDISATRMPLDELRDLMRVSPMLDHNKMAVRRVLCDGWSTTAAAEPLGISPSTVHRACESVLMRRKIPGVQQGPEGAFEIWYAKRCIRVEPIVTDAGLTVPQWSDSKPMREDLEQMFPGQVTATRFGMLMRLAGHAAQLKSGSVRYYGVKLIDPPVKPKKPAAVTVHSITGPESMLVKDPKTGRVIGTRMMLGTTRGKAVKGGEL